MRKRLLIVTATLATLAVGVSVFAQAEALRYLRAIEIHRGYLHLGKSVSLIFEGATTDGYETTLTVADPTADRTWTVPDSASDTFVGLAATQTLTNKTLTSPVFSKSYTYQFGGQDAKVGATAGWVLGAANNLPYLATMAASQTGGTLVIPITMLQVGAQITGFKVVAQVESAGNTVTIDADLRAVTNVAAEPTDASIGTMTQVSVTADTAVSQAKTGLTETVTSGKTYYLLITATTAASTDIILQAAEVTLTEI